MSLFMFVLNKFSGHEPFLHLFFNELLGREPFLSLGFINYPAGCLVLQVWGRNMWYTDVIML